MDKENLFCDKGFKGLTTLLLGVLIVFFIFSIVNSQKNENQDNTISVTGYAEINTKPDVARITLTVVSENKNLSIASNENNQKVNAIVEFLKENGVEEKDIKTSLYNINPRYEYLNDYRNRYLAGYDVRQSLDVKVRNLDSVGDVIAGATSRGANDIGSLQFIVDNDELLKEQAREEAIKNAKAKAEKLGNELGVSLTEIIGFYEQSYSPIYGEIRNAAKAMADEGVAISPSIQSGENTIASNITIVYKIK